MLLEAKDVFSGVVEDMVPAWAEDIDGGMTEEVCAGLRVVEKEV